VPTAITVTATQGGTTANGLALRVMVLTGAAVLQNGGTASATNASSTSITTTQTGSRVYGAMVGPNAASTPNGITTQIDDIADAVNGMRYATFKATSLTGTPGATTIGDTNAGCQGVALFEVLTDSALWEDLSAPAVASTTSATAVTTASFTPPGDSLLVALVSSDGGSGVTTMDVQGGGLIWTQMAASNVTARDYVGVWIARVATPDPDDPVITATQGGSTGPGMAMRIYVLTGAKPRAQQTGATTNTVFAASTSFTQSITTTQTGSRVYGASSHFPNSAGTAVALTTLVDDVVDATNNGRYATFKATSLTGTPGATTLGFTVASSAGPFAQAEILTAGTLVEDGSAPAVASTTTQTFVSCLNFTPPAGSLLVVLVASDGGAAVTTMTVSGGGLTFTELVKNNTSGNDYAGVWVADIPAAAGGVAQARPGRTWQRRFHHREWLPQAPVVGGAVLTVDQTDDVGLTDSVAFIQQLERTDPVGLTDSVAFIEALERTDSAGLTDNTAFIEALERTDSAGLTDTATVELVKLITQTDDVGLTDSVLFTESLVRTDSAGLTDSALIQQELVRTDSAGLTDSNVRELVKLVTQTDDSGLTDTTAFAEQLVRTDSAGLTDTTALTEALVRIDSAGLTDTSIVGLQKDVTQTDLVGLTDTQLFAQILVRTDDAGLTDTAELGGVFVAPIYGRSSLGTGRATAGVASTGGTSAGKASTGLVSAGAAGTGTAPRGTPGSGTTTTGKPGGD